MVLKTMGTRDFLPLQTPFWKRNSSSKTTRWSNEDRDRNALSDWLDKYRENDPDPTEP
jgi:hypothetical protein